MPLLGNKKGFLVSWLLGFSFLFFWFLVSWFLGFEASWFLGFRFIVLFCCVCLKSLSYKDFKFP